MGLLSKLLFGSGKKANGPTDQDKNRKEALEREMEQYGLSEDEKKLVRSGQYDPWNFEEEEMDEDDYYHDDD